MVGVSQKACFYAAWNDDFIHRIIHVNTLYMCNMYGHMVSDAKVTPHGVLVLLGL